MAISHINSSYSYQHMFHRNEYSPTNLGPHFQVYLCAPFGGQDKRDTCIPLKLKETIVHIHINTLIHMNIFQTVVIVHNNYFHFQMCLRCCMSCAVFVRWKPPSDPHTQIAISPFKTSGIRHKNVTYSGTNPQPCSDWQSNALRTDLSCLNVT